MLKVKLLRRVGSAGGDLCGFAVAGHAGYADYGKDIVCAGVSAIAQAALFGLEDIVGAAVQKTVRSGYLEVFLPPELSSKEGPAAVLRTFELGIKAIETSYPGTVSVTYGNCNTTKEGATCC